MDFLDGPFQYEELRNRVSAYVGVKLAGQDANCGAQPMDIEQSDKSQGEEEDVNAVQQRRPHDRSNQKHKQESRKPFNRRTANSSPSAPRFSTPRDQKPGSDETKQSAGKKKRLICYRCGGKGHLARLCLSGDDCQDVDEVGTEPPSDADSLVWIGAMTQGDHQALWGSTVSSQDKRWMQCEHHLGSRGCAQAVDFR